MVFTGPQLCDDSFEEHVLPYSLEQTGLHLHGLNECSRHFKTQSTAVVEAFAREWGFIVTPSHELRSIPAVKSFTDEISSSGKWNGEALEGFVVRTTVSLPPINGDTRADASPYAPGSSFFFKVKFDEPYMMYRDWREITKSLLSRGEDANLPKNKMKRPETQVYVDWVRGEIKKHPKLFEGYTKGHGIIATRERFLEWLETKEGRYQQEEVATIAGASQPQDKQFGKTIIVAVAVPGVGTSRTPFAFTTLVYVDSRKAKRQSQWPFQTCLALDTRRATISEPKNAGPHSFRMSRGSCETTRWSSLISTGLLLYSTFGKLK
jgi:tRNA ligase